MESLCALASTGKSTSGGLRKQFNNAKLISIHSALGLSSGFKHIVEEKVHNFLFVACA